MTLMGMTNLSCNWGRILFGVLWSVRLGISNPMAQFDHTDFKAIYFQFLPKP